MKGKYIADWEGAEGGRGKETYLSTSGKYNWSRYKFDRERVAREKKTEQTKTFNVTE